MIDIQQLEEQLRISQTTITAGEQRAREAEERAAESEARLKLVSDLSSDWYWELDAEFRFTSVVKSEAPHAAPLLGGHIGKTRWELPYLRVSEEKWNEHKAVLNARQPFHDFVMKRFTASGDLHYISISGVPIFDAGGNFKGYRGIARNITERKKSEQQKMLHLAVSNLLTASDDISTVMPKVLQTLCEKLEWDYAAFWSVDKQTRQIQQINTWHVASIDASDFTRNSHPYFHRELESSENAGVIRRTWLKKEPLWIADVTGDPGFRRAAEAAKAGLHAALAFPVVVDERVLGVIEMYDREVREPDLLLLEMLRTVGREMGFFYQGAQLQARQRMEHIVTRLLAESNSTDETMPKIIQTICETMEWDFGAYWSLDEHEQAVNCTAVWHATGFDAKTLLLATREKTFLVSELRTLPRPGHMHHLWQRGEAIWIGDIGNDFGRKRVRIAAGYGLHSLLAFPIMAGREVIGAMEFFSYKIRQPDDILLETTRSIGIQIGQFCKRKQAEERIRYLAYYDELTGLPNRSLFNQRLNHALTKVKRNKASLAVLFVDLDRFKNINDTLGHEAGDRVLQEMAKRFKTCLRQSDTVARLGGDEFVVLLEDITDPKQAANVAGKIIATALKPFAVAGGDYHVTASIGISIYPDDGEDDQTLMKHADIAMYLAKDQGKNNYQYYSRQINVHSFERLALESSLRRALEGNQFLLHYQAKVDLNSGCVTGMEALLRWMHPDLGMVSPTLFIPLAEETGLIVPIGRWVIQTACAQNKAWQDQGLPALPVSVNLSARQFNDEGLLRDIEAALAESGLAAELLELEITESMVMYNPDKAVMLLTELRAMGISIAIDDFGIGYSSLSQLKRFPINTIKVDRSFIKDLMNNKEDAAITGAIIAMGQTLKLNVIAEGVESADQIGFLRTHNCNEMQGFYFSKPIPENEFADMLRSGKALLRKDAQEPE
jgi:diguanylate cyclase (GGDEF)-like protein